MKTTFWKVKEGEINFILDVSGSFVEEPVKQILSMFLSLKSKINLILIDTEIRSISKISSPEDLDQLNIVGYGGTILQPALDYVLNPANNLNKNTTILYTDGVCEPLTWNNPLDKSPQLIIFSTKMEIKVTENKSSNITQIVLWD